MIHITYLKHQSSAITRLSQLWKQLIGDVWAPDVSESDVIERFKTHMNTQHLALTCVAFHQDSPIGMCSLREHEGIRPELTPWLGSLVVDPDYQRQGVGRQLIAKVLKCAKDMGYTHVHLFTFDPTLPAYYAKLGWELIGLDQFHGRPITVMHITL
jgi:GNAT superfamily N-acetyltransferase